MHGETYHSQQRERALLDGGCPVRRGGDEKDGRGGQHRADARECECQPDGARSGGPRGDSDDRQQRQEQVVEALVEGHELRRPRFLDGTRAECGPRALALPGDGLQIENINMNERSDGGENESCDDHGAPP